MSVACLADAAMRTYDGMVVIAVVVPAPEGEEALRLLGACGQPFS